MINQNGTAAGQPFDPTGNSREKIKDHSKGKIHGDADAV